MQTAVIVGPLKPGMSVYGTDGQYFGEFVFNLTDNPRLTPIDLDQIDRCGPSWYYVSGPSNTFRPKTNVYGSRDVFSADFGKVEQFLIKSFDELVWINAPRSARLFNL